MNLRVIRVNKDDLPKEDSPFKVYDFIELAQNDNWEESHVFQEICDKRYMFVVFKEEAPGEYVLNQVKFWGFPERLLMKHNAYGMKHVPLFLTGTVNAV